MAADARNRVPQEGSNTEAGVEAGARDCMASGVASGSEVGAEAGVDAGPIVGIDLGTTHSLVAVCDAAGPRVLLDEHGRALLGGECAEMPDIYKPGDFDIAGFCVGVVELERVVDAARVKKGDVVIGLRSSGVHSNGYTLVRRIIQEAGLDLEAVYPDLGPNPLWKILLEPTRIYAKAIVKLLASYKRKKVISGMAHITGGGLPGNLSRALGTKVDAVVDTSKWQPHPIFPFLAQAGVVSREEMFRVFNMGIGYVLLVRPAFADSVVEKLAKYGEEPVVIGEITKGTGEVRILQPAGNA